MNFVTFHANRPRGEESVHPNTKLVKKRYMQMIDLMFRSARLFHLEASCTLLTDNSSRINAVTGPYQMLYMPIDYSMLMLSRAEAQLKYIEKADFLQPMVLIDSDILINGCLKPLLHEDFDVALTWRKSASMPINGGVIILNNKRPEVSIDFFRRFVAIYREQYAEQASWYGDQLVLRDMVGLNHRQMSKSRLVTVDGCKILLLPCDTYNFSPADQLNAISTGLPDKLILHFKGRRKRWMELFWNSYLLPLEKCIPPVG